MQWINPSAKHSKHRESWKMLHILKIDEEWTWVIKFSVNPRNATAHLVANENSLRAEGP